MLREVVTLLRELRPEEGLGEGIDQLAALVHHAYLFWAAGQVTLDLPPERLAPFLTGPAIDGGSEAPAAFYIQVPERRVWAQAVPDRAPEPLDGCFVHVSEQPDSLRVLGVFGIHAERDGFSVVEASGSRAVGLARQDGSRLYAPVLPGGEAARLYSVVGEEELLELGWRAQQLFQLPAPSSQLLAPS